MQYEDTMGARSDHRRSERQRRGHGMSRDTAKVNEGVSPSHTAS
jgi:hypothetical protein